MAACFAASLASTVTCWGWATSHLCQFLLAHLIGWFLRHVVEDSLELLILNFLGVEITSVHTTPSYAYFFQVGAKKCFSDIVRCSLEHLIN